MENTLDMTNARKNLCSLHPEGEDKIWVTKRGKKIFAIVNSDWLESVLKSFELFEIKGQENEKS